MATRKEIQQSALAHDARILKEAAKIIEARKIDVEGVARAKVFRALLCAAVEMENLSRESGE